MADYSQLMFNPFAPETLKQLEQFEEFAFEVPDKQKIIAYMILMYDPRSDMKKLYPDNFYERKLKSAIAAGFSTIDGRFETWVEQILVGENDGFNDAQLRFTRMFGIPDYPAFIVQSDILDRQFKAALKETDPKKLQVIQQNIKSAMAEVSLYERNIFGHEETENVRAALYRLAERQKLGLRPEDKATEIDNKTLNVFDPHYPKKK